MTPERVVQAVGLLALTIAGALIGWVTWEVKGNLWLTLGVGASIPVEGTAVVVVGVCMARRRDRRGQRLRASRVTRDVRDPNWIPPGWLLPSHDPEPPGGRRH